VELVACCVRRAGPEDDAAAAACAVELQELGCCVE
jgi:hypothetical protein